MSRKRWIFLGIMLFSIAAFVVDRLVLSSPQSAEAAPVESAAESGGDSRAPLAKPAPSDEDPEAEIVDDSLTWLKSLRGFTSVQRNLFAPSTGLLPAPKVVDPASVADPDNAPVDSPTAFREKYELTATFVSGANRQAIVNQRIVGVGESVEGFRLVKVDSYSAEFQKDEHHVRLEIELPTSTTWPDLAEPASGLQIDNVHP